MHHRLKHRTTPLALLIAFLGMLYCGLLAPAHACCVLPTERVAASHEGMPSVSACCQTRAVVLGSQDADSPARPFQAATPAPVVLEWPTLAGINPRVAAQSAFVEDQSNRHLELSVLLN